LLHDHFKREKVDGNRDDFAGVSDIRFSNLLDEFETVFVGLEDAAFVDSLSLEINV
jgi:hypothetical protein